MDSVDMKKEYDITIVIINWNGSAYLEECFQSAQKQSISPLNIVVIDNHSSDGSQNILKTFTQAKVVLNQRNVGFSAACNQGIKISQTDFVLVMNSDVILGRHYVENVLDAMWGDEKIGMGTGKILRFDHQTIDTCGQTLGKNRKAMELGYGEVDRGQFKEGKSVFSVCGAVALIRRAMLEDVAVNGEYFDEDFFAFYEDIDLGWRARNRGWKAYYTPQAIAYHFRGGTNGVPEQRKILFSRYEFIRRPRSIQVHIVLNRYLMMIKNDRFLTVFKDLPSILFFELCLWGYILLFRPFLILDILRKLDLVKRAYWKRKVIQSNNQNLWRLDQKTLS